MQLSAKETLPFKMLHCLTMSFHAIYATVRCSSYYFRFIIPSQVKREQPACVLSGDDIVPICLFVLSRVRPLSFFFHLHPFRAVYNA